VIRILALATNPVVGASTRFRLFQWEAHLVRAGFRLRVDAFYLVAASRVVYQRGKPAAKLACFVAGAIRRSVALAQAARRADLLFVHREAFPFGWRVLFDRVRRFPGPVVYDYDDAMFLPQQRGQRLLSHIECLATPAEVMARSQLVFAGNGFLAEYARRYASHVTLLPTCIDTERFRPAVRFPSDPCVVGWIGSHSTAKYLQSLGPVLARVAIMHRFVLYVVGIPDPLEIPGVEVVQAPWSLGREVADFQHCDLGLYPLWTDEWSLGKCGFKAIQFMACGVPVVASAVGANREIVEDGVNGFLAVDEEEWVEKLGLLLADRALREKLGQTGRQTVEERYSLTVNAPVLVSGLREALAAWHPAGLRGAVR
jgi:glycosyltransferase involved in cell wall biosynthesis